MSKDLVEVKSEFDAEFRRFSIQRGTEKNFLDFYRSVEKLHDLKEISFVIFYADPVGDLLPITNDENFKKALTISLTVLRLSLQRKDENWSDLIGYSTLNRKKEKVGQNRILSQLPLTSHHSPNKLSKGKPAPLKIGMPEDFRQVSAIIDVDKVPQNHRRVRLLKHGSDKPLGFYIRDGVSIKVTPTGLDKVAGIFISRLVAGGLAESTGLISVNDEIVEVNGIEVAHKSLDQVTDMMIANSCNLIITVKPANQQGCKSSAGNWNSYSPLSVRNTNQRLSQKSIDSSASFPSESPSSHEDDDEIDEIRDLTRNCPPNVGNTSGSSGTGSHPTSPSSSPKTQSDSFGKRKRQLADCKPAPQSSPELTANTSNGVTTEADHLLTL